jgi:hypothetical protein
MANSTIQNKKVISLALGAVVDGAYLYAGADRGIASEIQGKGNGETVYYKTTNLGQASIAKVTANSANTLSATNITQRQVPVTLKDAGVMYNILALDKQITTIGKDASDARIGQKLAKKGIKETIMEDLASIGNVFVATGDSAFQTFQKAVSFLKSHVEGTLYGFMDWNIWGDLTGKGQQAVPCALAAPRFGMNLVGSWTLIDQLRVIPDVPQVEGVDMSKFTISIAAGGAVTLAGASGATTTTWKAGIPVKVNGVKSNDVNDEETAVAYSIVPNVDLKITVANNTITKIEAGSDSTDVSSNIASFLNINKTDAAYGTLSGAAITNVLTAGKHYAGCIIRAQDAQAFGTVTDCPCEGAKYEKSSLDGITVHCNKGQDIPNLSTDARYDIIFASKLVEPRAAVMVWYQLD